MQSGCKEISVHFEQAYHGLLGAGILCKNQYNHVLQYVHRTQAHVSGFSRSLRAHTADLTMSLLCYSSKVLQLQWNTSKLLKGPIFYNLLPLNKGSTHITFVMHQSSHQPINPDHSCQESTEHAVKQIVSRTQIPPT